MSETTREALHAALAASTKWLIGERDSLFECITDGEGRVLDDGDNEYLQRLDALIDENRRLLGYLDAPQPATSEPPLSADDLAARGFPVPGAS